MEDKIIKNLCFILSRKVIPEEINKTSNLNKIINHLILLTKTENYLEKGVGNSNKIKYNIIY